MKNVVIVLCALCAVMPVTAGRLMKQLFAEMPDSLMPVLSHTNRLDCIDFMSSNMRAAVKNNFGEQSTLQKLTADYALMELSPASRCELKLLVNGTDSAVCMIHTCLLPAPESEIAFYDTRWKRLDGARFLKVPQKKDFEKEVPADEEEVKEDVLGRAGVDWIAASFAADSVLSFTLSMDDGNPDLRKELEPFMKDKLKYMWQKGLFVLVP